MADNYIVITFCLLIMFVSFVHLKVTENEAKYRQHKSRIIWYLCAEILLMLFVPFYGMIGIVANFIVIFVILYNDNAMQYKHFPLIMYWYNFCICFGYGLVILSLIRFMYLDKEYVKTLPNYQQTKQEILTMVIAHFDLKDVRYFKSNLRNLFNYVPEFMLPFMPNIKAAFNEMRNQRNRAYLTQDEVTEILTKIAEAAIEHRVNQMLQSDILSVRSYYARYLQPTEIYNILQALGLNESEIDTTRIHSPDALKAKLYPILRQKAIKQLKDHLAIFPE